MTTTASTPSKFKPYTRQSIVTARQWEWLTPELQEAVQVVSHVLPFRTNAYVIEDEGLAALVENVVLQDAAAGGA